MNLNGKTAWHLMAENGFAALRTNSFIDRFVLYIKDDNVKLIGLQTIPKPIAVNNNELPNSI